MISYTDYEKPLAEIEMLCEAVSQALLDGASLEQLERASASLREASIAFASFTEKHKVLVHGGTELRARMKRIVTLIHLQRESLLRLAAQAERSLHTLIPGLAEQKNVSYEPLGRATSTHRSFGG
jgi:hypothetical protein